jgi:hypothetical protein
LERHTWLFLALFMVHDFFAAAQSGLEQVNGYGIYLSDAAYLARSEAVATGRGRLWQNRELQLVLIIGTLF